MRLPSPLVAVVSLALTLAALLAGAAPPAAALPAAPTTVSAQVEEPPPAEEDDGSASINLELGPTEDGEVPSQSIVIILLLTLLGVAPALLIMLTSFTRIVVVLSLARSAIGVQSVPPNQVIVGLALFLSLFVMGPTLAEINEEALQPLLEEEIEIGEAYDRAVGPMREWMLSQAREDELALFIQAAGDERPATPDDISLVALIPAFILSELKTAFIIGFVVFVPFLVIDMVVSSALMSMGMMMLPPVLISLPFKLLLFVMVDGWGLITRALLSSFR
ncbi:MAG: flagellar type III secretion system pore protein FliP [Acidimicrobiales bacterium]